MHREVRDHVEDILAQVKPDSAARQHINDCQECRDEVSAMADQAVMLRELRAPQGFDAEPRPGFYARVMERIEASTPISIWNLFIESTFGRRIGFASLILALVLGVYLFTLERSAEEPMIASDGLQLQVSPNTVIDGPVATSVSQIEGPDAIIDPTQVDPLAVQMELMNQMNQMMIQMQQSNSQDGVLTDLVTYREQ